MCTVICYTTRRFFKITIPFQHFLPSWIDKKLWRILSRTNSIHCMTLCKLLIIFYLISNFDQSYYFISFPTYAICYNTQQFFRCIISFQHFLQICIIVWKTLWICAIHCEYVAVPSAECWSTHPTFPRRPAIGNKSARQLASASRCLALFKPCILNWIEKFF